MEDEEGGSGLLKVLAEDHGLVAHDNARGSARRIDAWGVFNSPISDLNTRFGSFNLQIEMQIGA